MDYSIGLQIAIPFYGKIRPQPLINLTRWRVTPLGITWQITWVEDKPIPLCYEALAKYAIATNAKWLFVLDQDVLLPPHALAQLISRNVDVCCGVYYAKTDMPQPLIFTEKGMGPFYDWEPGDFFKIWAGGNGCCLIKTDVLKHIEQPWFKTDWVENNNGIEIFNKGNADLYFFDLLCKNGIDVWCDTKVICGHMDFDSKKIYPQDDATREKLFKDGHPLYPAKGLGNWWDIKQFGEKAEDEINIYSGGQSK